MSLLSTRAVCPSSELGKLSVLSESPELVVGVESEGGLIDTVHLMLQFFGGSLS